MGVRGLQHSNTVRGLHGPRLILVLLQGALLIAHSIVVALHLTGKLPTYIGMVELVAAASGLVLTIIAVVGLLMVRRLYPVIFAAIVILLELGFFLWYVSVYRRLAAGEMVAISWRVIVLLTAVITLVYESRIARSTFSAVTGFLAFAAGFTHYAWVYVANLRALEVHRLWLSGRLDRLSNNSMQEILDAREAIGQARVLLLASVIIGGTAIAYWWTQRRKPEGLPVVHSKTLP